MQSVLSVHRLPVVSRYGPQKSACVLPQLKPCRQRLGSGLPLVSLFRSRSRIQQQGLVVVAATPGNARALRAEIEELQEERELALRTGCRRLLLAPSILDNWSLTACMCCTVAQLNSGKTKKLAHELQGLHKAAFQAVQDNKEVIARRLLEVSVVCKTFFAIMRCIELSVLSIIQDKMQLSEELSSAEARSSANFNLAARLARVICEPPAHIVSAMNMACESIRSRQLEPPAEDR